MPVLDRVNGDPFMRAAPCVIHDGGLLKMWYVSCVRWTRTEAGLHYQCNIRYATSLDGIHWGSHDQVCIEPDGEDEYAVGRPWVLHEQGLYRMWYSRRGFRELYAMVFYNGNRRGANGFGYAERELQEGAPAEKTAY